MYKIVPPDDVATARLRLRRPASTDAAAVFAYGSDPQVARYADWPVRTSMDGLAESLRARADACDEGSDFCDEDGVLEVTPPRLEVADHRGAGDSLLAGTVAGIVGGERPRDAITLGAAAGALNVTRHGLGTGDADTVASLR